MANGRLAALFARYAAVHLRVSGQTFPLFGPCGRLQGHVDRVCLHGQRLKIEGWADGDQIFVSTIAEQPGFVTRLPRRDVADAVSGIATLTPGFAADLPYDSGQICLTVLHGGDRLIYFIPAPNRWNIKVARARLALPFLRDLARSLPAIMLWFATKNPACRTVLKCKLGLVTAPKSKAMQPLLFLADSLALLPAVQQSKEMAQLRPKALSHRAITIILPVFNAMDLLPDVLNRVVQHTDLPWRLILIEDASSDPAVRPFVRTWAAAQNTDIPDRVTVLENPENHGFIRSVNSGLMLALRYGDHVVLLNSDAMVPKAWATRLLRPFLAHDRVASVTPMSNDAEIFTAPVMCRHIQLTPGEGDAIDVVAAKIHPDAGLADAPTGVGFCMAISIDYLRRVPQLDTSFGRGYGEEVDWCQKVRALGGRHLGLANLFVEHRGGSSFGTTEKQRLITRNNGVISRRYPEYDADVQTFMANDPLITSRLALAIAWAAGRTKEAIPLYLAHSLGGGADDYLTQRIQHDMPRAALVLRVGTAFRWQLELHCRHGITQGGTDDFSLIQRLLDPVSQLHITYSCGVGDRNAAELPDALLALCRTSQDRISVLIHDYLPISPSYTLLNSAGVYVGLPDPATTDPAHLHRGPTGARMPLSSWQTIWGKLIAAASDITVFSQSSADLLAIAYPCAHQKIRLRPHSTLIDLPSLAPVLSGSGPVIGVLGNIGVHKGAGVLQNLSRNLDQTRSARLIILGKVDPMFPLGKSALIHGGYLRQDIPALVARYGITDWLIPSIWPETFSYTTHEALATGLPVWAFDLGAQSEAIRPQLRGGVIPIPNGVPDLKALSSAFSCFRPPQPESAAA